MPHRLRIAVATATAVAALAVLAPAASAHGGGRHRHHHRLTATQVQCLKDHGFVVGPGAPKPDLADPAVRAALFAALRDCGVIGPRHQPGSTTTTTSTSTPPIVTSIRHR